MSRFSTTRNNFLGGELSLRGDGRVDLPQYSLGCKELRNWIPIPSGGVTRRPGTRFVSQAQGVGVATIPEKCRIIPFVFSNTNSYIIVLWNSSTKTNVRIFDTQLGVSDESISGLDELPEKVENLEEIQFVQSADVMYLAQKDVAPFVIFRTGSAGSYVFFIEKFVDGSITGANETHLRVPYLTPITSTTITPSATVGLAITLTASQSIFTSSNVGSYYRISHGAIDGYVLITGYTSGTVVTAAVQSALGGTGPSDEYAESAWSERRGWPRTITFYNRRLLFGGNSSKPDTFWASQTSDFYQFEPIGTGPSDPQAYTLSSDRLNQIQWMVGGKKLTIGTIGGEHVGEFKEDGTEIFVQFFQETTHGSAYIQPQRIAYAIPFIQRSGRRVRELVFDFNSDSYIANDLTLLKEDIAEGYINKFYEQNYLKQVCYTEAPFPCIWAIDAAGRLYSCTRERNQQINAWATHNIGGKISENSLTALSGPDHSTIVESICVTPSVDNTYDRLWMICKRDVNGAIAYYVEYMDRFRSLDQLIFQGNTGEEYFYFLDSAAYSYAVTATNTHSGFDHLKNEEVHVMADGKYLGTATVSNTGSVDLPGVITANAVVVGYNYKSRLKTMRQEGGSNIGQSVGALRRVDEIRINLFKSRFFKFGFESDKNWREYITDFNEADQIDGHDSNLEEFSVIDPGENPGDPYYVSNDIFVSSAPNSSDRKAIAMILVDKPFPCTVLSITLRAVEQDV